MVTLDQRLRFAREHFTTKEGRPFDLTGRQWVVDQFWLPADGYKWWPVDPRALCEDCSELANTLTEWTYDNPSRLKKHEAETEGCKGLELHPVIMTVINLPRREGKTINAAAFNLATICKRKNAAVTYVAASEEQATVLFRENYGIPISNSKVLSKACNVVGARITVPSTRSFFEHVPTSHGSITGRGRTHVVIDEARDVPARVAVSGVIPSVFDNHGVECPRGHMHAERAANDAEQHCPVCKERLVPWYGRVIIMSSSGVLDGTENDWFQELVDKYDGAPDANVHVFRLSESTNPAVSKESKTAFVRVFGSLESTKTYADIEATNTARRKGEDFLSSNEIDAIIDNRLGNADGSVSRCVAFLDTSITGDLTSLVILAEDEGCAKPWATVRVDRIDVWNPRHLPRGVIDDDVIFQHLETVMPGFPLLRVLAVDDRGMPWAIKLIDRAHKLKAPWAKKVQGYNVGSQDALRRIAAWNLFEQRALQRTLKIPDNKIVIAEAKSVRKVQRADGEYEVRDRNRKKRHADVLEGIVACCYLAHLESLKKTVDFSRAASGGRAAEQLNRLFRPVVNGLTKDSF